MNIAAALKPFLGGNDPRSERQIESELDEEFAFHIEHITRELLDADPTLSHEQASCQARVRFGDTEQLKQRCKSIAMEDRIMLQRINAVLMVVVVLAVIGVSVQVYVTQRCNTLALQDITTQLTTMQVTPALKTESRGGGVVYIEGDLNLPGKYPLPEDGSRTLRRLFATAGGFVEDFQYSVFRNVNGTQKQVFTATAKELQAGADFALEADDLIAAYVLPTPPHGSQAAYTMDFVKRGLWREIDSETGDFKEAGVHIEVFGTDDIRNLKSFPSGVLEFPSGEVKLELAFRPNNTIAQQEHMTVSGGEFTTPMSDGRWLFDENGHLQLNLGSRYGVRVLAHTETVHASE